MVNNFLFALVALFMFAGTAVGAVSIEKMVTEKTSAGELVAPADEENEEAIESNSRVSASSLTQASVGATGISTGGCDDAGKDEDEDEDRDEDEDDWEGDDEDDRRDSDGEGGCNSTSTSVSTPTSQAGGAASPTPASQPPASQTFTMADVALHASVSDCYSAINGSVYDLTSFVSRHPGGSAAIKSLCGVDGTAAFSAQHAGARRPESELASLRMGVLR